MNVLVLGNGAREHALAWAIRKSPRCGEVFVFPGNDGIFCDFADRLDAAENIEAASLATLCQSKNIELCIIGPETLLDKGFADVFRAHGIATVGVSRISAQLESSKLFAKLFMREFGIPTARFKVAQTAFELCKLADEQNIFPCVLKFDGLAAGKGVVIANNQSEIRDFSDLVYAEKIFGNGSVLLEEHIEGREISYIGLCDAKNFVPFASATDYKRVFDSDRGPNTGGMGAISPSPYMTPKLETSIQSTIIRPFLMGLQKRDLDYRGVLFIGLMVDPEGNPFVLEFNVRFGDPETQAILLRLESDFLDLLTATASGKLSHVSPVQFSDELSVYVVAASQGYPNKPELGDVIEGLDFCSNDVRIFSAGIKKKEAGFVTNGGRVLGVGARDASTVRARKRVYSALKKIRWRGLHYRTDIGLDNSSPVS